MRGCDSHAQTLWAVVMTGAPRVGAPVRPSTLDADHFAAAASPVLRGVPAGQRIDLPDRCLPCTIVPCTLCDVRAFLFRMCPIY